MQTPEEILKSSSELIHDKGKEIWFRFMLAKNDSGDYLMTDESYAHLLKAVCKIHIRQIYQDVILQSKIIEVIDHYYNTSTKEKY